MGSAHRPKSVEVVFPEKTMVTELRDDEVVTSIGSAQNALKKSQQVSYLSANFMGILLCLTPPKPSRGRDLFMTLDLTDGILPYDQAWPVRRVRVQLFAGKADLFPRIHSIGDIVYLQNVKMSMYNDNLQITVNLRKQVVFAAFSRQDSPQSSYCTTGAGRMRSLRNFQESLTLMRERADNLLPLPQMQQSSYWEGVHLQHVDSRLPVNSDAVFNVLVKVLRRSEVAPLVFYITDASYAPREAELHLTERLAKFTVLRDCPNGCWVRLQAVKKKSSSSGTRVLLTLEALQGFTTILQMSHLHPDRNGRSIVLQEVEVPEATVSLIFSEYDERSSSTPKENAEELNLSFSRRSSSIDKQATMSVSDKSDQEGYMDFSSSVQEKGEGVMTSSSSSSSSHIPAVDMEIVNFVCPTLDLSKLPSLEEYSAQNFLKMHRAICEPLYVATHWDTSFSGQSQALSAFIGRITAIYPPIQDVEPHLHAAFKNFEDGNLDFNSGLESIILRAEDLSGVLELSLRLSSLLQLHESAKITVPFPIWAEDILFQFLMPGTWIRFLLHPRLK